MHMVMELNMENFEDPRFKANWYCITDFNVYL